MKGRGRRHPMFILHPSAFILRLSRRARCRCGLAAAVASELARGGELAELVPDHVLLHEHLQELVAVVDLEGVAHELRDDRAGARPRPDGLLGPVLVQLLDLAVDLFVYERALFCASAHVCLVTCHSSLVTRGTPARLTGTLRVTS